MNNEVNIFDVTHPQSGDFFKFQNIGDELQGTYIAKRRAVDTFGNDQTIYAILDKDGKVWNAGFRDAQTIIHDRMNTVKFGQIVGFRFEEERDSRVKPGTKAKIIRIYADSKFVDNEWLSQQSQFSTAGDTSQGDEDLGDQSDDGSPKNPDVNIPEEAAPANEAPPETATPPAIETSSETVTPPVAEKSDTDEAIEAVRNLAKGKGLVIEAMPVAEIDKAIEAFAGMPLEKDNLTKIIIKLVGYTK